MATPRVIVDPIPAAFKVLQDIVSKNAAVTRPWHDPAWMLCADEIASSAAAFRQLVVAATNDPAAYSSLTQEDVVVRLLPVGWEWRDSRLRSSAEIDAAARAKAKSTTKV